VARRRANGLGSISRRKDGRWEVAIWAPTTTGRSKRIRVYGGTEAEADAKRTELMRRIQHGIPVPDKAWKLGDYLDYWLEEVVRPARQPATYEKDELAIRLYLKPQLGTHTLTQLSVAVVQSCFNRLRTHGSSVANLHKVRTVLSAALTQAMKEELVMRNVARLIDLPSYSSKEVEPWSAEEARRFLEVAQPDPLYPAYLLSLLYGLRIGEVLGLRWSDIDFDNNLLHIRQQLQHRMGRFIIGPVKTKASDRVLRLHPAANDARLAQQAWQEAARTRAESTWEGYAGKEALVFTTSSGRPIDPHNFARSFHRLCERYGLRRIRVHDLRHTLATAAASLGASVKDVQYTLGHSEPITTLGTYQHGSVASSERVTGIVETALGIAAADPRSVVVAPERVLRSRQDSTGSRQIQPSEHLLFTQNLASTSGATSGIRTPDPRFTKTPEATIRERATSVRTYLRVKQSRWILGIVAVNTSRQNPAWPEPHAPRPAAVSASAMHTFRGMQLTARQREVR
jgi:integrase